MQLRGKVFIITGATGGMGMAIARLFLREGASLVLSGRDGEKGELLLNEIKSIKQTGYFVRGDVSDPQTNQALVMKAEVAFGRLDGLVTNAGSLGLGSVTEIDLMEWQNTMAVNLYSVFYLCRFAIPLMQKSGGGAIVVNSSIGASKSFPNHAAYNTSKAGLVALTKQIALDYGPTIRANVICPGPVDTQLIRDSAKAFSDPEKAVRAAGEKTAMKRLGQPEDIANLALFLASDKSSWMTGSAVTIDGGATLA